jgi:hypothetical protein
MTKPNLTIEDFLPSIDQDFSIRLANGGIYSITLKKIEQLHKPIEISERSPFSLLFVNPERTSFLPQGTYQIQNSEMGIMDIFLVPIGPDTDNMQYEAIFS